MMTEQKSQSILISGESGAGKTEAMKIGALSFEVLSRSAEKPYNARVDAKYKGQAGAVASRISSDSQS